MKKNRKQNGWVLTEIVVSITLMTILLGVLAKSIGITRKFNSYQLVTQQCVAAAQSQLDSVSVSGKAIDEEAFERLWPGLRVSIERVDGAGDWQGCELVTVKTSGRSRNRPKDVIVEMSRYLVKGEGR